jgi:hypothetical protein
MHPTSMRRQGGLIVVSRARRPQSCRNSATYLHFVLRSSLLVRDHNDNMGFVLSPFRTGEAQ